MPGILPMKVIKVGTSAQSRIAQACDRCRSKKIRCDGTRPTCTQCAQVGFECRTSDKLSRRAFPRGYTESLEERVRALEAETHELKDLLDEKDEKIDMLSKMHGNSGNGNNCGSNLLRRRRSVTAVSDPASPEAAFKDDTFRVQASPLLLGVENSDSYFMGSSSGRAFIETFKRKIQETGKPCTVFNPEAFLHIQGIQPLTSKASCHSLRIPPRLFSDRCVNVYFQEWAPLFPILHKPSFLHVYEEFQADPEKVKSSYKVAQLYLVFSIAGLSSDSPDLLQLAACEQQWMRALEAVGMENTMGTLQCLLLALLYFTLRADYKRLQHYKGIAVSLSHRLGLHQSQKRFSFGALTIETRKKVFWTLYALDCFTAATLGLPKLLKEEDVHTEFPSDTDDEYVTEKGFLPTLPGEFTRLSSALALFRCARILGRVLEKNYPAATTQELSLQQMDALSSELDEWHDALPAHLRLNFAQDKPSTDVTGSRSPLLGLAYNYTRALIYRPAVGSSLGPKAAPALLSLADASKHIIQIVQLLEERNLTFSFCLNKADLVTLCGMALLYQTIDLKQDGKLRRDDERLVNSVVKVLAKSQAAGSVDFRRVAGLLIAVDEVPAAQTPRETSMPGPGPDGASRRKSQHGMGRHHEATTSESDLLLQQEKLRRMTMPNLAGQRPSPANQRPSPANQRPDLYRGVARQSFDGVTSDAASSTRGQRPSVSQMSAVALANGNFSRRQSTLDYLSLGGATPSLSKPSSPVHTRMQPPSSMPRQQGDAFAKEQMATKLSAVSNTEWEALLGSMDGGMNNVYDAIYGGPGLINEASMPVASGGGNNNNSSNSNSNSGNGSGSEWSPDSWDLSSFSIGDFGSGGGGPTQSVLSMSDESLSSGEELAMPELGLGVGSAEYHNQLFASAGRLSTEGFILDDMGEFPL